MEPDATDKVLDAIAGVDKKFDEAHDAHEVRFERVEGDVRRHDEKLNEHDKKLEEHGELLVAHSKLLTDHATFLGRVQEAAHTAQNYALQAKTVAAQSVHEATTIVESAIRMHGASIAVTVQDAVRHQVEPLVAKVATQDAMLASQDTKLDAIKALVTTIAKPFRHPLLRNAIIVATIVGATIGGAAAGYYAKQGADVVTTKTAPPAAPITTTVDASAPDAVAP